MICLLSGRIYTHITLPDGYSKAHRFPKETRPTFMHKDTCFSLLWSLAYFQFYLFHYHCHLSCSHKMDGGMVEDGAAQFWRLC